jgi:hypothetical protein
MTLRNVAFSEERDLLCEQKVRNSCTISDKYPDRKSSFVNCRFGLKECDFVYNGRDGRLCEIILKLIKNTRN